MPDQWPSVVGMYGHQLHPALGKIEHLEGAGILDQTLNVISYQLLRTDQHIDRQGFLCKQALVSQVLN